VARVGENGLDVGPGCRGQQVPLANRREWSSS